MIALYLSVTKDRLSLRVRVTSELSASSSFFKARISEYGRSQEASGLPLHTLAIISMTWGFEAKS